MDRTELSEKELRRHEVLSRVERRELTLREAAELMEASYAQAKRLRRRHKAGGTARQREPRSNRARPEESRQRPRGPGCQLPAERQHRRRDEMMMTHPPVERRVHLDGGHPRRSP